MEVNELLMEQLLHSLKEQGIKASRGSIYYLEKKNLIQPTLVEVGTRKKRYYSWADYRLIAKAMQYTNMGLTVDVACELLMNPPSQYAWFLIRTHSGMACRFVNAVKVYKEVEMAAVIWGSIYDAILKVGIWHHVDRDVLLFREFPRWGSMSGAFQVYELNHFVFSRENEHVDDQNIDLVEAHIFINVPPANKKKLIRKLEQYDHILELAGIEGDMNFVIRVQVEDKKKLDDIVMEIMESSLAVTMKTYLSINDNLIVK
jgi:DNA-binding Lrp family transcriptional regulator